MPPPSADTTMIQVGSDLVSVKKQCWEAVFRSSVEEQSTM